MPRIVDARNSCKDCGKPSAGLRCKTCWGKQERREANPAWKGGALILQVAQQEQVRKYNARYYQSHREEIRTKLKLKRYVSQKNSKNRRFMQGDSTKIDLNAIVTRDKRRCGICHKLVAEEDVSFDHIIPLSRGGTHDPTNLQLAHLTCNKRRQNHGPAQTRLSL